MGKRKFGEHYNNQYNFNKVCSSLKWFQKTKKKKEKRKKTIDCKKLEGRAHPAAPLNSPL